MRLWVRTPWSKSIALQASPDGPLQGLRNAIRPPTTRQATIGIGAAILCVFTLILIGNKTGHLDTPIFTLSDKSICKNAVTFECESCLVKADEAFAPFTSPADIGQMWRFETERDGNRFDLDADQCEAAFPGLYTDMERAAKLYRERGLKITKKDMDDNIGRAGTMRAMVYDNQLYVIAGNDENNGWFQSRALGTLSAINRAVITAREKLPNVEFTFTIMDSTDEAAYEGHPNQPIMSYTRKHEYSHVWLMPDFSGWSYPETHLGTAREAMQKMGEVEQHIEWDEKIKRVLWRGVEWTSPVLRGNLVEASKEKSWGDVQAIKWDDPEMMRKYYLPIEDHCRYMFLAYTEGRSYSGRLRYLQNCHSIIFAHKLQWIVPSNYLLVHEGPRQNYVQVERDFSDLEEKVQDLLDHPEKARLIADNSVKTFKNRYLQPAADACYWRKLLKTWRSVSFEPEFYIPDPPPKDKRDEPTAEQMDKILDPDAAIEDQNVTEPSLPAKLKPIKKRAWRGTPYESYALMRRAVW